MRIKLAFCLLSFALSGCTIYSSVQTGKLEGSLTVHWIGPDRFIFEPDPVNPLKFTRANGDVIVPRRIFTDGGSTPRFLWAIRSYSPWGYAPGFIVHDFLYDSHHCGDSPFPHYENADASMVLAEIVKTMMVELGEESPFTLESIYQAVNSPIGDDLWENGICVRPAGIKSLDMRKIVVPTYVIRWPPTK